MRYGVIGVDRIDIKGKHTMQHLAEDDMVAAQLAYFRTQNACEDTRSGTLVHCQKAAINNVREMVKLYWR